MALALILRNSSRISACQSNFVKFTSVAFNRDSILNRIETKPNNVTSARFMSSDHSKLWPIEKAVSVGLLVLVPASIASPNVVLDNLLAVSSVIHFHWGLEAVVVDYVRPIVVGNVLPKLALGLLYLISATTLGGLIYYNINDIGMGRTIRKFWAIPAGGKGTETNTEE